MKPIHLPLHQELPIQVLGTNVNLQHCPPTICPNTGDQWKQLLTCWQSYILVFPKSMHRDLNTGKESASVRKKKSQYSSLGQSFSYSYKGLKSCRNKRFSQPKGHCSSSLIITSQIGKAPSPLCCTGFSTHKKQETRKRKRAKQECGHRLVRLLPLWLC